MKIENVLINDDNKLVTDPDRVGEILNNVIKVKCGYGVLVSSKKWASLAVSLFNDVLTSPSNEELKSEESKSPE